VPTSISGQKDEEMPWADESVKSDDGAAILPLSVLSDFRTNLHQLRDTVRRVIPQKSGKKIYSEQMPFLGS
jgi:hypothetical protein